ncbi:protein LIAT1 [Microcaecilia unicolor]|uniref:Protein LIAT1 n=1 Tax=Microcaecilia unicolor TaxID=1415580 RepID=A0A6P7WU49_9AMPH|nr:protein LIAT1 [Microcaecilia unicolor]
MATITAAGEGLLEKDKPKVKLGSKQVPAKVVLSSDKKKKKTKKKEKSDKASSPSKKRSHSSTPDERDKLKSKTWKDQPIAASSETQVDVIKDHESKFSSVSLSCSIEQDLVEQINESLRWHGILDNPEEEEERIRMYKMNRRRRYFLAAQERMFSDSTITQEAEEDVHLVQNQGGMRSTNYPGYPSKEQSSAYFIGHGAQTVLKEELGMKIPDLTLPSFAKISQDCYKPFV